MKQRFALTNFKSLLPGYTRKQEDVINWLIDAHAQSESSKLGGDENLINRFKAELKMAFEKFGAGPSTIGHRHGVVEDFMHTAWEKMRIFRHLNSPFPSEGKMDEKMEVFAEFSDRFFQTFYAEINTAPDFLFQVTSTGYLSPNSAQKLVSAKNWGHKTNVFPAYHFECNAAIPVTTLAQGLLTSSPEKKVCDIVHTEFNSLFCNPAKRKPDQLVIQTLFADGVIKYSLEKISTSESQKGFEVLTTHEVLVRDTLHMVTYNQASWGMEMTLSKGVPDVIHQHLGEFVKTMLQKLEGVSIKIQDCIFAFHPGGPKIIDFIQGVLGLADEQLLTSRQILFERGNMGSATLPHVWERLLAENIPSGTPVISLAFSPGFTVSGMVSRAL